MISLGHSPIQITTSRATARPYEPAATSRPDYSQPRLQRPLLHLTHTDEQHEKHSELIAQNITEEETIECIGDNSAW